MRGSKNKGTYGLGSLLKEDLSINNDFKYFEIAVTMLLYCITQLSDRLYVFLRTQDYNHHQKKFAQPLFPFHTRI